jgi:hypothetical protein
MELELASQLVLNAIKKKFGFNFDINGNKVEFNSGYMVGGYHKCLKFEKSNTLGLSVGITKMLFILRKDFDNEHVLGWWENNGCIYLDISKCIKDFEKAKEIGFNHNQVAIYDIKNAIDIKL